MGFDLPWDILATLERGMRIHCGDVYLEIEAALSSLPALLPLKGINKRRLPFLTSGCSVADISQLHLVDES